MEYTFSKSVDALSSSAVREILKLTQGNQVLSLAGGLPAEDSFPIQEMREAFNRAFDLGAKSLQYGLTDGYIPLREWVASRMKQKHMNVGLDNMLLTTGSQQAVDLLCRVYLDEGDVVLVENPTYLAAVQLFQFRGIRAIPVEGDSEGMDLEDLAKKIAQYRPKMVYVIPTFANPTGKVWSLERRQGLLAQCKANNILILEDDPYGEIQFDGEASYRSIFSLDEHPTNSCVVYTSTFSKIVAPGLRTGWAIGDQRVISMMVKAKQAVDLQSSTIDQIALHELLSRFDLESHIEKIRASYKERMEWMNELLLAQSWDGVQWEKPRGGMFLWVNLPADVDAEKLLARSVQEGVAFVPGKPFYAAEPQHNTMRLNYTLLNREDTQLAIARLGKAFTEYSKSLVTQ
ncbi:MULTISPECIES: PLP-dependent aminotransferase family protein [Brevibacillus]|jgi:2-aminoadipate transaminase|uniref:Aminotransferase n=1 Tax=Brevibacillus parabrevis TaxID=54914 RepID=A0A4Y3PNN0_BREPA|nr:MULTISPECIES: PLP-dependent aminotransferase family protein [Brevibacillus]MDH6351412.1 2-aminoadipate transaminase [Brevibacillus sp. 1238]MDR4998789.1 PLP-dependent aminotransferase family protein [Brevibacillus parabrevis]MED2254923.1 PLP-dependent aminotransferase family protein [Brevibacillus parabrevis]NRQ54482.1 PLP-dependent aminotransferase family protein [Brevibacillus sp. HD1.4A]RNB95724.1 PLP-dependent aminotransferase family protein [Brevibacillus parabrevis]